MKHICQKLDGKFNRRLNEYHDVLNKYNNIRKQINLEPIKSKWQSGGYNGLLELFDDGLGNAIYRWKYIYADLVTDTNNLREKFNANHDEFNGKNWADYYEELPMDMIKDKDEPIKEGPIEKKPIKKGPIEETPIEETPIEKKPIEEKPIEEGPIKKKPIEEKPIKKPTKADDILNNCIEYNFKLKLQDGTTLDQKTCSGIYISPGIILTAGHCFKDSFKETEITITSLKFSNTNEELSIDDIKFNYFTKRDVDNVWHDISVITFNNKYKNRDIINKDTHKQIKIKVDPENIKFDENINGWGTTSKKVTFKKSKPSYKNMPEINKIKMTNDEYNKYFTIFCNHNMEKMDSGGPIYIKSNDGYLLIGLISEESSIDCNNGLRCVNIAPYIKWIESFKPVETLPKQKNMTNWI